MSEKSTLKGKDVKGMPKTAARKRSYRPVQYGLVVTAFLASFMGTVWLQHQDAGAEAALLAAGTSVTSEAATSTLSDAPSAELVVVPTAPAVATDAAVAEAPAEVERREDEFEEESDEESDEEEESVIVALPTPTATVPSVPTVQPSVPSAQLAARQRAPRAVARSRSSR